MSHNEKVSPQSLHETYLNDSLGRKLKSSSPRIQWFSVSACWVCMFLWSKNSVSRTHYQLPSDNSYYPGSIAWLYTAHRTLSVKGYFIPPSCVFIVSDLLDPDSKSADDVLKGGLFQPSGRKIHFFRCIFFFRSNFGVELMCHHPPLKSHDLIWFGFVLWVYACIYNFFTSFHLWICDEYTIELLTE